LGEKTKKRNALLRFLAVWRFPLCGFFARFALFGDLKIRQYL